MNKQQKIRQEEVIKNGGGWACYLLARDVAGADVKMLQEAVLKKGTGYACYLFARGVAGADKEKLMARYNELK